MARLLGFRPAMLTSVLYFTSDAAKYAVFEVPKKSGDMRSIAAPMPRLKLLQQRLAALLQRCFEERMQAHPHRSSSQFGYLLGKSVKHNAERHRARRYVLNVDLADFFQSINFGRVRGFFISDSGFALTPEIATTVAQIACFNNGLPPQVLEVGQAASGQEAPGFLDSLYFSVVTITTLGYGDIVPADGTGRTLVVVEVLLGVVVIGLFLNSLWQAYTDRIAAEQRAVASAIADGEKRRRLRAYLPQLEGVFRRFAVSQRLLMGDSELEAEGLRTDFAFKDLSLMFTPSLSMLASLSGTAIEDYFVHLERLNRELRFVLSRFDIDADEELHRDLVEMLQTSDELDTRAALASYSEMAADGRTLAKDAAMLMEAVEGEPEVDDYGRHMLFPVVVFNKALREQTRLAGRIIEEFRRFAATERP